MRLTQIIESLLFASDAPLSAADLSKVDERLDEDTVEAVVQELRAEYELTERSFQIYEVAGGFQLLTRPEFVTVLERYDSVPQPSRLSAPALEVLAIIAYRQPLGRAEIEDIRGVGSSGVLRTLQERSLVEPVARGEGLGRPLLYGTTSKFLEHFGFRSLEDLPRPDELPVVLRDRTPVSTMPLEDDAAEASPDAPSAASGDAPVAVNADSSAPVGGDASAADTGDAPAAAEAALGDVSHPAQRDAGTAAPVENSAGYGSVDDSYESIGDSIEDDHDGSIDDSIEEDRDDSIGDLDDSIDDFEDSAGDLADSVDNVDDSVDDRDDSVADVVDDVHDSVHDDDSLVRGERSSHR